MNEIQHNDIAENKADDLEMVKMTYKWLNLKYSLRKFERNWEPKSKKILNELYAKYKHGIEIENLDLNDKHMHWINLNKSVIKKQVHEFKKKCNYISFLDRTNTFNNYHTKDKNKWQSQQIKKKNIYKGFVSNMTKYKHSKKQRIYKTKTKPNLKKKKRYSNNAFTKNKRLYNNIYIYNKRNLNNNRNKRNYSSHTKKTVFHNTLSYLLAFKFDKLLNKRICINNGEIKGKLTCISQSGQYKLEQMLYKHKSTMQYSYWFHINMTQTVHIIDDNNNTMNDTTDIFMDVIKLKLIQYFIFICSYKLDENKAAIPEKSPLKFLFLKHILNKDTQILCLTDNCIKKCKFIDKMSGQFCYGTKNNDFEYFNYSSKNFKKPYLNPEQLLSILYSYVCLCKYYIQNTSHTNITNKQKQSKNDYMLWDTLPVKKLVKHFSHDEYAYVKQKQIVKKLTDPKNQPQNKLSNTNKLVEIMVSHVETPVKFYVNAMDMDTLQYLSIEMEKLTVCNPSKPAKIRTKKTYAAKYGDCYARVTVFAEDRRVCKNENWFVQYVDYGMRALISTEDFVILPSHLRTDRVPILGKKCALAGICVDRCNKICFELAKKMFTQYIFKGTKVWVNILYDDQLNATWFVELFVDNQSINEMLAKEGFVTLEKKNCLPKPFRTQAEFGKSWGRKHILNVERYFNKIKTNITIAKNEHKNIWCYGDIDSD